MPPIISRGAGPVIPLCYVNPMVLHVPTVSCVNHMVRCLLVSVEEPAPSFFCSCRLGLAAIGFLVFLHNNMQRVAMSVAIICMVNQTAIRLKVEEDNPSNSTGNNGYGNFVQPGSIDHYSCY